MRIRRCVRSVLRGAGLVALGFAALSGSASAASVLRFGEATPLHGSLVLDARRGAVLTPEGGVAQVIALADVDAVTFAGGAMGSASIGSATSPALPPAGFGVWLVDGSWLPARSLSALAASADSVQVETPFGDLTLPLAAIAGWGSEEPPRPSDAKADLVVVGDQVQPGRVAGLKDGALLFSTGSGAPVPLVLAQIRAVRLAVPLRAPRGVHLALRVASDRPALALLPGAMPTLAAASSATIADWQRGPLATAVLRVEGGRRAYLSDLNPSSVSEEGAFGVVWPWTRDSGLYGEPLRLAGQHHARGLTVHSAARLEWQLAKGYVQLRALIGIADTVAPEGDCVVSLRRDGVVIWGPQRLRGGEAPLAVDVDLQGAATLTLDVALGERHDIGDHVVLADAWLIRR